MGKYVFDTTFLIVLVVFINLKLNIYFTKLVLLYRIVAVNKKRRIRILLEAFN